MTQKLRNRLFVTGLNDYGQLGEHLTPHRTLLDRDGNRVSIKNAFGRVLREQDETEQKREYVIPAWKELAMKEHHGYEPIDAAIGYAHTAIILSGMGGNITQVY